MVTRLSCKLQNVLGLAAGNLATEMVDKNLLIPSLIDIVLLSWFGNKSIYSV